jgi:hypothetical protein
MEAVRANKLRHRTMRKHRMAEEGITVMEILYMTNKMRLIMIFIITNALHVSGVIANHQKPMNCISSFWYR